MAESNTTGRSALNLNLCFTKIKFPQLFSQTPTQTQTQTQTLQQQKGKLSNDDIMTKNFNSLYEDNSITATTTTCVSADLATAFASRRFFVSAPGMSNSIVNVKINNSSGNIKSNNAVAVSKMSPDPYGDFKKSMEEMIETRPASSESLQELLLCYLALNPKTAHKFIIGAFSDLVVSLLPTSS